MHRGPRRAEMHVGAGQMQVMLRVAAVQRDVARGNRQHVLDQRARENGCGRHRPGSRPLRSGVPRPRAGPALRPITSSASSAAWWICCDSRLGQRLVLSARHARPNRAQIVGQGGRANRHAVARPPERRARAGSQTSPISLIPPRLLQVRSCVVDPDPVGARAEARRISSPGGARSAAQRALAQHRGDRVADRRMGRVARSGCRSRSGGRPLRPDRRRSDPSAAPRPAR